MSLVTYADARPWARSIKTRVASREMPPFHVDRTIGIQQFKNDRSIREHYPLPSCNLPAFISGMTPSFTNC